MIAVNRKSISRIALLVVGLVLCAGVTAVAVDEVNTDRTGLAIDGYDPVAYFVAARPLKGSFQITAEYEGAVYRFVTEHSRKLFLASPQRYAPKYGGYCAYGVSVGQKFSADPTVWQIEDGRLYLNLDSDIAELFNQDLQANIAKAEKSWKSLADQPAK